MCNDPVMSSSSSSEIIIIIMRHDVHSTHIHILESCDMTSLSLKVMCTQCAPTIYMMCTRIVCHLTSSHIKSRYKGQLFSHHHLNIPSNQFTIPLLSQHHNHNAARADGSHQAAQESLAGKRGGYTRAHGTTSTVRRSSCLVSVSS